MSVPEVLVTGGTGVLGRRVVECLSSAGIEAQVLSRSGRPGTIRGDLLTGAGLERAIYSVNAIVHCASNPYRKTRQTDVGGTEHLL
jgi:nucleoside-diphosphate-sugar epimerase